MLDGTGEETQDEHEPGRINEEQHAQALALNNAAGDARNPAVRSKLHESNQRVDKEQK